MFDSFVTRHWFHAEAKRLWSDEATLQAWLDVEAALAQAQAGLGLIPAEAAATIAAHADARLFDTERLAEEIAFAQHPLVPVLHRFEELCGEPAAGYLHWGATTQNIFDTASALQMTATHAVIARHLEQAIDALSRLALEHRVTAQAGRTHGQHALPMTFGFKVSGWIDELDRERTRLDERLAGAFPACMGGAIGTFAAMGPAGREVERQLAALLGLRPAGLPMRSSYDRASDYIAALGLLAGTAQKIAQDVVFMQRTEIGEAAESFHVGKVGSSTMAHKRNPSTALLLASLARMLRARVPAALEAMVRMDEGDSSATNVTDTLLPEAAIIAASVAQTLQRLAQGLVVDPQAMQRNLTCTQGLIASEAVMMRLTPLIGRHMAHRVLYDAAQRARSECVPFLTAIVEHPLLQGLELPPTLAQALEPSRYVGGSASLTDETVARVQRR
ncbi:adenylosuccinate lyase family protein [Schlegelella sp. S2-27]|uniref:Adenylosuccinate lyase family protein n=1 Tax=Caldimonas mangrovi TaxID=2944811 RepID=A0ABT0YRM1_9BURK|nr:adenylosuccinate lyase family protein [Caldimonas mangrovi]MCM5681283.1 adenylosuccinate lyase family protein [Caldimonas mangrovi]